MTALAESPTANHETVNESVLRRSGIYAIINRLNGDSYVGKAADLLQRWRSHVCDLRGNRHPNAGLQESYNVHGEASFAFNVLERCDLWSLKELEYDWIVRVRPNLNRAVPDYVGISKGRNVRRHLSTRRKDKRNREPNRYICSCGQLKALGSRYCLFCARAEIERMKRSNYFVEVPRTRHGNEEPPGTSPRQLRTRGFVISRTEFFAEVA